MSTSQALWLAGLVGAVCSALLGQAELLGEPWRHLVTVVSVVATAVSGYMLQRPSAQAYFIQGEGVLKQVNRAQFEQHARLIAESDMAQPLPQAAPRLAPE